MRRGISFNAASYAWRAPSRSPFCCNSTPRAKCASDWRTVSGSCQPVMLVSTNNKVKANLAIISYCCGAAHQLFFKGDVVNDDHAFGGNLDDTDLYCGQFFDDLFGRHFLFDPIACRLFEPAKWKLIILQFVRDLKKTFRKSASGIYAIAFTDQPDSDLGDADRADIERQFTILADIFRLHDQGFLPIVQTAFVLQTNDLHRSLRPIIGFCQIEFKAEPLCQWALCAEHAPDQLGFVVVVLRRHVEQH